MAVKITDNAISEVKRFRAENNLGDQDILALGVMGGGCSGFQYKMSFLKEEKIDDRFVRLEFDGLKVAVDRRSLLYMDDVTVDYYQGLDKRGFVFDNPKATGKCGCGSSFSI